MVRAEQYAAIYAHMLIFGLAAATKHLPTLGSKETACRRLGGENEPAIASGAYHLCYFGDRQCRNQSKSAFFKSDRFVLESYLY